MTAGENTPVSPSSSSPSRAELVTEVRNLSSRNRRLAELLKSSRDKLAELGAKIEELGEPASTYGTFLELSPNGRDAEVFTAGRRMRLKISPTLQPTTLTPGALVRLGEGAVVVEDCGTPSTGELAVVSERIDASGTSTVDRALVTTHTGEERLVTLASGIASDVRAGDTVLIDSKAGFAFERIPKTEVTQLSLEEVPDVTFSDIGGLDSQIEQIRDAVELPFAHPELYRDFKLTPPKGVLLYGPPGSGKTLIAKAVANSLASRIGDGSASYFLNVKGPELLNKFVGETERRIRLIFERARELASDGRPVIIFFDEMESIFRTRGSGVSSDMETTVVPQMLTELDGVEDLSNVIAIGATNREELIDPALLRPGRLDVKIRVPRPDRDGARDIFTRYLTEDIPHTGSITELIDAAVDALFAPRAYVRLTHADGSEQTLYYSDFVSGAMIANIVDRAKKLAIKDQIAAKSVDENRGGVTAWHLREAVAIEQRESEDLPNTSNPDEWSKIAGYHGQKVISATVVAEASSPDHAVQEA